MDQGLRVGIFFILGLYFIDLYQQNEEYINSEWNVLGREFI